MEVKRKKFKAGFAPDGMGAYVKFSRNNEIQRAYEALMSLVPRRWAERRRLTFQFYPLDESYGDLLADGLIVVKWGIK